MSEVLIPMGSQRAYALYDMAEGVLFNWSHVAEYVEPTTSGERPIGIVIAEVKAGEILSEVGAAEWFCKSGIVRVPVPDGLTIGSEVMSGAAGAITAYVAGTSYAFGQVLTYRDADGEAEIYIY